MKKKAYMKPALRVVVLQHRTMLLAGSILSTSSNLELEDVLILDGGSDSPAR